MRLTGAETGPPSPRSLLDRFTHRCHIFEMNGESYRLRESAKQATERKHKTA